MAVNKLKQRNWFLIAHLLFTILFVGGSFTQWLLILSALTASRADTLIVSHELMHKVDLSLIIPGLLGVIITGVFLSVKTHWGLVKHYWLIVKELLTLVTLGIGSALNIWVQGTIGITEQEGLRSLQNPAYLHDRTMLMIAATVQTFLLIFVIVISVAKPWGKRNTAKQRIASDPSNS
ncbi:hypothetical protein LJK88_40520 [Paenibacillus sp. P26]|nr:hypothetical protein LJK88_40520 [Paenibacillus sp. P26]UUZ92878.1 hypothetical protein LJK87_47790 [Paenibacillus sp. P25]